MTLAPNKRKYDVFDKTAANYVSLSPLSFLPRAAKVFPNREAVVYGNRRYSWSEVYQRCRRLASALSLHGIGRGDTVAVMASNTPEMIEAHYGIAMAGGVLNAINVRLEPDTVAYILEQGEAKALIVDTGFAATIGPALEKLGREDILVVDIVDFQSSDDKTRLGSLDYETLLAEGDPSFDWSLPADEWDALSLNYTSGTSGRPKGVVYHHRGSYLMTLGTITDWHLPAHPRYLYTVPLFHCNGWGHVWTMTALAGTIVCCRAVTAAVIYTAIAEEQVSHFGGAPIVLAMILNADESERRDIKKTVEIMTAGAPPPTAILQGIEKLGFNVIQVYGLTETYGHTVMCTWNEDWDKLPFADRATIKARQGVAMTVTDGLRIVDTTSGEDVVEDGVQMGELLLRGNTLMKGYLKDPDATAAAFAGGWFRSGDLGVVHPGGYVEIKDRLKDIIISGGENISSVEVENTLHHHPAVALAAVVAAPDKKWGEVPCAFIELKSDSKVNENEILGYCKQHLAGFKQPKLVVFCDIPKTATGKIQKHALRKSLEAKQT